MVTLTIAGDDYDLVVAGSGIAGLAAAIIAQAKGLRVIIIEKTGLVGGTSAYSGGVVWVPNSCQNIAAGVDDSPARAKQYLDSTIATSHEDEARLHYIERGAEAFEFLESVTKPLFFVRQKNSPDYYPEAEGALLGGRAMTPYSCDGRILGDKFVDLRGPLPEFCLFGRQMLELADVYHLLNAQKSLTSAIHSARLVLRDLRDRVFYHRYRRGTRLTGGNALVATLYKAVLDRRIPVLLHAPLVELTREDGMVTGVVVNVNGARRAIRAGRGVVLATGGFPWSKTLRAEALEQVSSGNSATSPDSTGDGITAAVAVGAKFDTDNAEGAFWTPVSLATRKDGSTARFPHLMADRAKPGFIAVNKFGERFYNEAENYHDFTRAMLGRFRNEDQQPVHFLCDADYVRNYAFGALPPLASDRRRAIASGYIVEAASIAELADKIGVDGQTLVATIAHFNRDAETGVDTQFGKGASAYNRYLGDAAHGPNPCLAPLVKAPFYAMKVHAGDIGTAFGLKADVNSRVLDASGTPIDGLYACGSDRNSIMGGYYPSGGITIGPAIAFAYFAVLHASQRDTAAVFQDELTI